jgi:hypothetical protein
MSLIAFATPLNRISCRLFKNWCDWADKTYSAYTQKCMVDGGIVPEIFKNIGAQKVSDQQLINTKVEAAVFRRLLEHLDSRKDVQNIELMELAGFCRNCLSKWYVAAAEEQGVDADYEQARERVYGMSYKDWKSKYQTEATAGQKAKFASHQAAKK